MQHISTENVSRKLLSPPVYNLKGMAVLALIIHQQRPNSHATLSHMGLSYIVHLMDIK